jgi:hypothetical protein
MRGYLVDLMVRFPGGIEVLYGQNTLTKRVMKTDQIGEDIQKTITLLVEK